MKFPQGFTCQVAHVGLKAQEQPELAVLLSERPCAAAGVFTTNLVTAAPVRQCREQLSQDPHGLRAVVVNSKNANAVTGPQGELDCRALLEAAAPGLPALAMSTGVIGQLMPMHKYLEGLNRLQPGSPQDLALAMMTTDTYAKLAERSSGGTRWLGVAKGAGMIHPNMATMLALVVTDAQIPAAELQAALAQATEESFHCITVDGDSSTNDTLLLIANAQAGPPEADWKAVLTDILQELARKIAFDGEGARHHVTLEVSGVADATAARQVGRTVLTSPLVKTAIAGKDANWGRILAAAGRAGVDFDPRLAALEWNGLSLLEAGMPKAVSKEQEAAAVDGQEVLLRLKLGEGPGFARLWSCDLTHEYVSINGDYRT